MVWQDISIHGSVEFSVVENGALNGIKYRNEILIQFKNKFSLPKKPILLNWKVMHVCIVQTLLTKTFSKRLSIDWDDH